MFKGWVFLFCFVLEVFVLFPFLQVPTKIELLVFITPRPLGSMHTVREEATEAFPLLYQAVVVCPPSPLASGVYVATLESLSTFCGSGKLVAYSLWRWDR